MSFRYAICSEIFGDWELGRACALARSLGYTGLEIAPFQFAESVDDISSVKRSEMRRTIQDEDLSCVGIHWLLVSPKAMHLTTAEQSVRNKSWAYLDRLIDFCADLGGKVMVLGSPLQRNSGPGVSARDARSRLAEGLAGLAPHAASRGVTLLMEPVSSRETDVVVTLSEAAEIVERVDHPAIQTMFDTHNASDEGENIVALLERHYPIIRHVHVNEVDGRHPGTGDTDFKSVMASLAKRDYAGWVSLEVFDFEPGPETIARESIEFLRAIEEAGHR